MLRRLLTDSLVYGAADVFVRGFALVLIPLYTRLLAPEEFGLVDISIAFLTFVTLTVGLEITQAAARMYPDAGSPSERRDVASTALLFGVAAYTAFLLAALFAGTVLEQLVFGGAAPAGLIQAAITAAWLAGMYSVAQRHLRWSLRPTAFVSVTVTHAIVTAAVALSLVLSGAGPVGLVIGHASGFAVGLLFAVWLARDDYHLRLNAPLLRAMLAFSAPLVISSAAVFVTLYVDRIAISQLMGFREVGIFGVGLRVASIVTIATVGVQLAIVPLTYAYHHLPTTRGDLATVFRAFVALAIVLTLALALFAPELVAFFAPLEYSDAAAVVPLLVPALLFSTMYIFAPGLAIAKRTPVIAGIYVLAAVINTAGNLILIPIIGILGAALATLIGAITGFGMNMWWSQREYPVPHRWGRLAAAVTVGVASYLVVSWTVPESISARVVAVGAMVVATLGLGLLRPAEIGRAAHHLRETVRGVRSP